MKTSFGLVQAVPCDCVHSLSPGYKQYNVDYYAVVDHDRDIKTYKVIWYLHDRLRGEQFEYPMIVRYENHTERLVRLDFYNAQFERDLKSAVLDKSRAMYRDLEDIGVFR